MTAVIHWSSIRCWYTALFSAAAARQFVESIAIDTARNVYVTGYTFSEDFPLVDPFQSSPAVAFVSKLNSSGTALVYSTYLGGTSLSGHRGHRGGRQRAGLCYRHYGGVRLSARKCVSAHVWRRSLRCFSAVLNPAGNALEWSTYLGGSRSTTGRPQWHWIRPAMCM